MAWPEIDFSRLNANELMAYRSMLLGLIEDIEDAPESTSEETKNVTFDVLTQKLNELYRHISIRQRIGGEAFGATWLEGLTDEELRLRAAKQSLEIFGRPDVERFNWLLAQDRMLAETKLSDENPVVREYAQKFLNNTTMVESYNSKPPLELDDATRLHLKTDLFALFPGLQEFTQQEFPEAIPVEDSLRYFNEMRDIFGLPKDRYEAYFTNKRACEETPRGVSVGLKRKPLTGKDIIRLAFHEWMHVLRRHNALKQDDPVKRLPTINNLAFEEAFCVLLERSLIDESYISGMHYYMSIGLQMGLDKTQNNHDLTSMRSFRETVDIMAIADGLRSGADTREAFDAKRPLAYNRVMRTARGNAMDARDLSYHSGDQRAKQAIVRIKDLTAEERRAELMKYLSAQFDPTNESESARFAV